MTYNSASFMVTMGGIPARSAARLALRSKINPMPYTNRLSFRNPKYTTAAMTQHPANVHIPQS